MSEKTGIIINGKSAVIERGIVLVNHQKAIKNNKPETKIPSEDRFWGLKNNKIKKKIKTPEDIKYDLLIKSCFDTINVLE